MMVWKKGIPMEKEHSMEEEHSRGRAFQWKRCKEDLSWKIHLNSERLSHLSLLMWQNLALRKQRLCGTWGQRWAVQSRVVL